MFPTGADPVLGPEVAAAYEAQVGHAPESYVLAADACVAVLLAAIARIDPASVNGGEEWREAIRAEVTTPGRRYDTAIGTIGFDANGDPVPQRVSVYRGDPTTDDWGFWQLIRLEPWPLTGDQASELTLAPRTAGRYSRAPMIDLLSRAELARIVNLAELEPFAVERMTGPAYDYVAGGAWDEVTLQESVDAWRRYRFVPRVLRELRTIDVSGAFLGRPSALPIAVAPMAAQGLAHPGAEAELLAGAARPASRSASRRRPRWRSRTWPPPPPMPTAGSSCM